MLGSLAIGDTRIEGFLEGEDSLATLRAFRSMGVRIDGPRAGKDPDAPPPMDPFEVEEYTPYVPTPGEDVGTVTVDDGAFACSAVRAARALESIHMALPPAQDAVGQVGAGAFDAPLQFAASQQREVAGLDPGGLYIAHGSVVAGSIGTTRPYGRSAKRTRLVANPPCGQGRGARPGPGDALAGDRAIGSAHGRG